MQSPNLPATSSTLKPAMSADGAPIPMHWVEDLFERLAAILGASMANVYAGAKAERVKAEWAEALAGFSADEVKRGLAATRTRKFAPNLPDFLHLCRPALDPELAWIEAEQGMASHGRGERFAWSHPAVYWAAREIQHELRSSTFALCRKRWERLLADQWARGSWAQPPDPTHRALPAPTQEASEAARAAGIASLRALRQRITGHATRQEQAAAVLRAEAAALVDPRTITGAADA